MKMLLLCLTCITLCCGCVTTTTRKEFNNLSESVLAHTLGLVYYKGRKGGFDYFRVHRGIGFNDVRLLIEESPIDRTFPFTRDKKQWRASRSFHLGGFEFEAQLREQLNKSRPVE